MGSVNKDIFTLHMMTSRDIPKTAALHLLWFKIKNKRFFLLTNGQNYI
jgi:hypothetical protein